MKRKILFFTLLFALLACVFAISASAADVEFDGVYFTTYDNATAYEGFDGTATVNTKNQLPWNFLDLKMPDVSKHILQ